MRFVSSSFQQLFPLLMRITGFYGHILSFTMVCFRTRLAVMNPTHRVVPGRGEIPVPLTLGLDLTLTVVLDLTPRLKTTAKKRPRIMNPATKSRVESLQPSKWTLVLVRSDFSFIAQDLIIGCKTKRWFSPVFWIHLSPHHPYT